MSSLSISQLARVRLAYNQLSKLFAPTRSVVIWSEVVLAQYWSNNVNVGLDFVSMILCRPVKMDGTETCEQLKVPCVKDFHTLCIVLQIQCISDVKSFISIHWQNS